MLLALVPVLSLPLVHLAIEELRPELVVDYASAEWKAREGLVKRAKVFVRSPPAIATLDLSRPPGDPHPLDPATVVECQYEPKPIKATTPKFDCRLPSGEVIKVKYGRTPEKQGEVAATRLLAALGFGADHVTMAPRVRCRGCPAFPFQMRRLAESFLATPVLEFLTARDYPRDFTWVSVEKKLAGRAIEVGRHEGWDWRELPLIDPAQGGATRAEIDALRLIAMFLNHWDNKAANQRLLCENAAADPAAGCETPLLMLQDVGATFGPTKVQHDNWAASPIWADKDKCTISLQHLPYRGGNFTPIQLSEDGRALLAGKLTQLSEAQIRALFESARFPDPATGAVPGDVTAWVDTFRDRVRKIADRPACPPLPEKEVKSGGFPD